MFKKTVHALPEVFSRVVIGTVFIESGWGKFHSLDKVISYFDSLGIPFAQLQAPFVAGTELIAGIFILVGLFTRFASVPLIGIMCVAIWTAKREDIDGISSLFGISEFLYILILTWLSAYGGKYMAIDALLGCFCKKEACQKK